MPALEVSHVRKSYGSKLAVDDVSLKVEKGIVFGLLGPNGAGKTSLIRMIMDITRPDTGEIRILGEPMSRALLPRIGYLPEERGLYQKQRVGDILKFLGELKDLPAHIAAQRVDRYLDRVGLLDVKRKKMCELSKGMQQKVQIAAVLLHEPDFLVLDEPFSGLDPVNRLLIIEIMKELSARGATVVLSTHLMDQVQALCHSVFLIHQGRGVLEGSVREVQERFADNAVILESSAEIEGHPMVERAAPNGHSKKVWLKPDVTPETFVARLIQDGATLRHFERALPTIDEIFVKVVK